MSQGLCFFDSDHRLIVCNDRFIEMYDIPPDRVSPGMTLTEIVDLRFEAGSFPAMTRDEYLHWRSSVAISNEAKDSIVELMNGRTFKIRHRPMPDGGWVATHEDITEQRQSEVEDRAHRASRYADRAAQPGAAARAARTCAGRVREGEMVAVHLLDLDRFKAVNDTFGHPAGDKLLKIVADRLRGLVGETDTMARMGGDEFAIVQARSGPGRRHLARAAHHRSDGAPYDIDGQQALVGASIGIAVAPATVEPRQAAAQRRSRALPGQGDGRGTFRFFEPAMDAQMQAAASGADLRKALAAGEFELHYQPLVKLASNESAASRPCCAGIIPSRAVSPADFIPLAEENGLIVPLGEWVIRQACADAATGRIISRSRSTSRRRRSKPRPDAVIVDALAASGLPPTGSRSKSPRPC